MAAHRYWRARGLLAYDGGASVDLSEFWLLSAGTRVDTSATLTSSVAPTAGSLSSLSDNDTATGCTLSTASVLTWDFGGAPTDVDDIRLGSADTQSGFLRACVVEWSDDGTTWVNLTLTSAWMAPLIKWPGARSMTVNLPREGWDAASASNGTVSGTPPTTFTAPATGYVSGRNQKEYGRLQFEVVVTASDLNCFIGVRAPGSGPLPGQDVSPLGGSWNGSTGSKFQNGFTAYSSPYASGDVIGVVMDFSTGELTFYKNGVSQGVAFSNLGGQPLLPAVHYNTSGARVYTLKESNFDYPIAGADPWEAATYIAFDYAPVGLAPAVISNGWHESPYSGTIFVPEQRARPNFHFDPAARGRIVGTVKRKDDPANVPLARRVRLYRDRDGMLIAETWSDAAGNYEFNYIEEGEAYTAIALDHQHFYRAVAADNLTLANGNITLLDD